LHGLLPPDSPAWRTAAGCAAAITTAASGTDLVGARARDHGLRCRLGLQSRCRRRLLQFCGHRLGKQRLCRLGRLLLRGLRSRRHGASGGGATFAIDTGACCALSTATSDCFDSEILSNGAQPLHRQEQLLSAQAQAARRHRFAELPAQTGSPPDRGDAVALHRSCRQRPSTDHRWTPAPHSAPPWAELGAAATGSGAHGSETAQTPLP
jgi:hypothetical protein